MSRNAAAHSRRRAQGGEEWLCPTFGHEDLSGLKGIKHRFPHELCGRICDCSWPPNALRRGKSLPVPCILQSRSSALPAQQHKPNQRMPGLQTSAEGGLEPGLHTPRLQGISYKILKLERVGEPSLGLHPPLT